MFCNGNVVGKGWIYVTAKIRVLIKVLLPKRMTFKLVLKDEKNTARWTAREEHTREMAKDMKSQPGWRVVREKSGSRHVERWWWELMTWLTLFSYVQYIIVPKMWKMDWRRPKQKNADQEKEREEVGGSVIIVWC